MGYFPARAACWALGEAAMAPWQRYSREAVAFELLAVDKSVSTPISTASYNPVTQIAAACTDDGWVVMQRVKGDGKIGAEQNAAIQLLEGPIYRFVWGSDHEFIVASGAGSVLRYDLLSSSMRETEVSAAPIHAIKKRDAIVYAGDLGGGLWLLDERADYAKVAHVTHMERGHRHSVTDVEAAGNYVYAATANAGRVWLWDRRNLGRRVGAVATHSYPCSIIIPESKSDGTLPVPYVLSHDAIIRLNGALTDYEVVCKDSDGQQRSRGSLRYCPLYDLFVWNRRDVLHVWDGVDTAVYPLPGLAGFCEMGDGRYLCYTNSGELSSRSVSLVRRCYDD
ncbi:hypothetical protein PAPHI01_1469 [Pancytospora philotis]|nr:hypothetical protein PAPHI01_1469 [Pancytospora philotis]